jgi:hypothetical protein
MLAVAVQVPDGVADACCRVIAAGELEVTPSRNTAPTADATDLTLTTKLRSSPARTRQG